MGVRILDQGPGAWPGQHIQMLWPHHQWGQFSTQGLGLSWGGDVGVWVFADSSEASWLFLKGHLVCLG